jgi:glyoxylase-like metal-dependent hydrolase (beta-lactamase superfamily II)
MRKMIGISRVILCGLVAMASHAQAAAPPVHRQPPGYFRLKLGDFEVTALSDGTHSFPAAALLTRSTPGQIEGLLRRAYLTDPVETSVNAFLINTGSVLVLIDTGAGDLLGSALGRLLDNLKAAGYEPAQVDEILLTHMHPDHIGGLLAGAERAFPNALVRADKAESEYWLNPKHGYGQAADVQQRFSDAMARINPYIAAGKFAEFADGTLLQPGIRAMATRGHTPGHTTYMIESRGEKMLVLGDLVHVAAVQFPQPAIALKFDYDQDAAVSQRMKTFAAASADGYWIAGAHLPFPGIGHIRADTVGYEWVPVNYGLRF